MQNKKSSGTFLIIVGVVFATLETIWFGCNWLPKSRPEELCDLIAIGLVFVGVIWNRWVEEEG